MTEKCQLHTDYLNTKVQTKKNIIGNNFWVYQNIPG